MEVYKSFLIKNVSSSKEIEDIQGVIKMIIKDENPDFVFNPDEKTLLFEKI